ncbi:hypothetical protein FACS189485_00440 [Spirochaetia bacterium]|nr:hypothetical protein FACS189485_00440 [Spirochaetia bacterium]
MKKPHFFCDNCGAEVDRDTKLCPKCGRFFAAIRCPRCGFTGTEELFVSGCPKCGYSVRGIPPEAPAGKRSLPVKKEPREPAGTLPLWVYILTALALVFVFGILFMFLK